MTEAAKRPQIQLRPREGRRVRAGAPWIFSNEIAIDAATRSLPAGTLVEVLSGDGRAFGAGYYNRGSLIAVRLFEAPPGVEIDANFFATRISRALSLRDALFDRPYYRLVHAEGDFLPGLVIDRYNETCVVQITTAGMEALLSNVLGALERVIAPTTIILRADSPMRALEGLPSHVKTVKGTEPERLRIEETGLIYFADLLGGQKTGWYFDQRENRAFVSALARGRSVLDLYCHSGGFAISAAAAGARQVRGVDSSATALALARQAADANQVEGLCELAKADAMEELERLGATGELFDIVICDPPPFVRSRKDVESGARAYRKLARLAARVTAPDGFLLLASCSHNMPAERFLAECAAGIRRADRRGSLIRASGAGPDHPVHPMLPETAYLKTLVFRI
ncbi:MAG TPA: class I SAM-dependent rRNA methyltransferase [Rhizomicrobium sp.]|jgi:23S rRNA (cytosine1962-C5)-methyltransferase